MLTLKTAIAARKGRGRMFIPSPGYAEFQGDRTSWLAGSNYLTGIATLGSVLQDDHVITHGILEHRYRAGVWSRVHAEFNEMTAYVVRSQYHFLRSRRTAP